LVLVLNLVDGCIHSDLGTGNHGGDRGGASAALRGHEPAQSRLHPIVPERFVTHQQSATGIVMLIKPLLDPSHISGCLLLGFMNIILEIK
jgi:hypothetical protein